MKQLLTAPLFFLISVAALAQSVGIGTNAPNAKAQLDISSTSKGLLLPRMTAAQRLNINPAANAVSLMVFDTDSSAFMFWTGSTWSKLNGNAGSFWVDNGNGNISSNNAGYVGIGTNAPTHKLSVVHNSGTGMLVKSASSFSAVDIDAASGDAALRLLNNGTIQWNIRNQPGTDDLQFFEFSLNGQGGERFKIQNTTGNIGINQTSPAAKLDVNGTFKLTDGTQGAGKILTSDANGIASWQSPAETVSSWTKLNNNIYNNNAGNVGIGTTAPGFPLNFATATGDKISLYGNSGSHYGFGIQGGLLQIHSDAAAANIAFGYGSSGNFTERMRIINSGLEGMTLDGRLTIRSGQPSNAGGGGGVWLTKPDNSALLGFMGTQNSQNIGFFGGPGGWGFTYDAINSRVGIGNNNPNAPLAFAPLLGKKITLYPGATGDAGLGMAGNRLQIYADNPNADVAIGYDAAGTFNERFAVKPTGALAVNGNTGVAGQVITSNGSGNAASWASATNQLYNNTYSFGQSSSVIITGAGVSYELPGLNQNIVLTQTSKVLVSMHVSGNTQNCFACGEAITEFRLYINNATGTDFFQYKTGRAPYPGSFDEDTGFRMLTLGPGTHNFKMIVQHNSGPDVYVRPDSEPYGTRMIILVIPQ